MKSKLRWLLLFVPLALFAWAYQAASWRPKLIGVHDRGEGRLGVSGPPQSQLLLSPDGKQLVSYSYWQNNDHSSLALWSLKSREKLWQRSATGRALSPLAFSPDSQTLVVATDESVFGRSSISIYTVETATGKRKHLVKTLWQSELQAAAFLSKHQLVVTSSRGAVVVNAQTGKTIRQWKFELPTLASDELPPPPQSYVSTDGTTIIALANGKNVAIYDSKTGKQRGQWIYKGVFRNPRLSPDGKLWAMQQENVGLFEVYDAKTGVKLHQFAGDNTGQLWSWSADSQQILSSPGAFMAISDARAGRGLGTVPGTRNTLALALDPRGDYYYTLDNTGKIWRWRAR